MLLFLIFLCAFTVTHCYDVPDTTPVIPVLHNVLEVPKKRRVIIDCSFTPKSGNTTFMWTKHGTIIEPNRRVNIATNGSLIIERFLDKRDKSRVDSGFYECYATDNHGTFIARQVELKVHVTRPKLIIEPDNVVNVVVGGVARIQCHLDKEPSNQPVYIWEYPKQISGSDRIPVYHTIGVLQVYNVTTADEGRYKCMYLSNDEDNVGYDVENSTYLSVHSGQTSGIPKLINTPTHISVPLGKPALLECLVQGGTKVKISWLYANGTKVREESDRVMLSGKLNLEFSVTTRSDSGQYKCVTENSDGFKQTRHYYLHVNTPPEFTAIPQSSVGVLSGIIRLKCLAVGNPEPTIQWYKDGLKLFPSPGMSIDSQLLLYGLFEDSGYYQCIANNSQGIRIATARIQVKMEDNVPEKVSNVTVTPLSAREVNVTWTPVASQDMMELTACFVGFQIIHDIECPGRCMLLTKTEREVSKSYHLVIRELKPFTTYRFAVHCLSAVGASMMSDPVTAKTLESVPTAVPNVEIKPDSSTSFRVSWGEIPKSERHGVITEYRLSYGKMDSVYTMRRLSSTTREYLVTGLDPNSTYIVQVLAGNSAGFPKIDNNWVTYRTPVSYQDDDHVTSLKLVPVNSSAVKLVWSPPENVLISEYRILVMKLLEDGQLKQLIVPPDKTNITITGLEHRVFYQIEFMVKDNHNKMCGYVTELYQSNNPTDIVQPPPPYLLNIISRSSSKISLSWEAPKTNLKIVGYTVSYQKMAEETATYQEYSINSSSTYATLQNLQPFTLYVIAVKSYTQTSEGPFCKPIILQTKEGLPSPPENLLAIVVSPGTVQLKWGPPRQQNGIITYYIIYYNDKNVPDKSWISIHQNASTTSVILEDLTSKVYYFKLKACTNAGEGTSSNVIKIENLYCEKCPKCNQTDADCKPSVPEADTSGDNPYIFQQKLGIIIGCGVGVICVIISVTYILFKQRQMRARYLNRPRTELVGHYQNGVRGGHLVAESAPPHEPPACSPMLRRMLENTDFTYKSKVEQKALLSPSSSGSVNNQTGTTNTDSGDTTPGSSDTDLTYQQINDHVS